MQNKKAFSFVEIIIAISIIVLLAVIGLSSKQSYDENKNNTKVISDTETIKNALESYSQENASLPMPGGNTNFYAKDTSYEHSYTSTGTFGVYGSLTEKTLAKKYLDILPLDPRTNSYYSYGKTKETNQFEIASVQVINGETVAKVTGNYTAETGSYNLIREYNGSNFVYDGSKTNLPYNPDELVMIVTDENGNIYRQGDTITTTSAPLELFFSDGSVSVLEANSSLTLNALNFKGTDNLNTFVKLALGAGTIWTKATHLNDNSEFEVYTTDSTAAVRGTIFGVSTNGTTTDTIVIEGTVEVTKITDNTQIERLTDGQSIKTDNSTKSGTPTITPTLPEFSINTAIRDTETENNVMSDAKIKITPDFESTKECLNPIQGECSNSMTGYTLVAYAPYNTVGDLNLYNSNGINPGTESGAILGDTNNCNEERIGYLGLSLINDNYGSFCKSGTTNGIVIENFDDDDNDFLKYSISNLNLGNNFAIEMRVLGSALRPTDSNEYYLYDGGDVYLKISGKYLFMGYKLDNIHSQTVKKITLSNLLTLQPNTFYEVEAKYNGTNWELKVGDLEGERVADGADKSLNNIYIGSKNNYTKQLNNIIDYVKIYTKN